MINIKGLSFLYNDTKEPALNNINIDISEGEFVGIAGPTGAGKSTLTLCLNGVIPHFLHGDFYGEVKVDGKDTVEKDCAQIAYSVGSVFQDPEAQIVSTCVEDEIAFGLENLNIPRIEIASRIKESLEMTGISDLRNYSTSQLSGGQKQRVAIASAIALRPKILVLDEPTSELDPKGSLDIFNTLKKLNMEYNITIVVVEQKIQLLSEYCSRIVIMEKGNILLDGPTRSVLADQETLQRIGVSSPPVTRLAYMLKKAGLYQGDFPINVEEAHLMVSKVLSM
ncbi:MAG TPA: ATP-binding cassette domain-containing protein [Pseudobacteroides sp.]|uniref:energy-coupling factor ABC transporter ATP-binding protein n=1 Tax=Pseudobacteroides sp. TaxID=1968840 RepID=UPI002F952275